MRNERNPQKSRKKKGVSRPQKERTRNKNRKEETDTQRGGTSAPKSMRVTFVCTILVRLCRTRGSGTMLARANTRKTAGIVFGEIMKTLIFRQSREFCSLTSHIQEDFP